MVFISEYVCGDVCCLLLTVPLKVEVVVILDSEEQIVFVLSRDMLYGFPNPALDFGFLFLY